MKYRQGEIVIAPFPFSDLSSVKQRPVLILSNNKDNKSSDDLITCGITSNLKKTKHSIMIDENSLESGAIPKKSMVKVDKIFTLEKTSIIKRVAKINNEMLNLVKKDFYSLV